jgi:Tol biopolymer transport system component
MHLKHKLACIVLSCVLMLSGAVLLMDGNIEIYVMDADGANTRRLTDHPFDDYWPTWSPDSRRIAFTSNRGGNQNIYVMDADGRNVRRLTSKPEPDYEPAWSPDGKEIAFGSGRYGEQCIYVMNPDGRNVLKLTDLFGRNPAWFDPSFAYSVSPAGKGATTWGWAKQISE